MSRRTSAKMWVKTAVSIARNHVKEKLESVVDADVDRTGWAGHVGTIEWCRQFKRRRAMKTQWPTRSGQLTNTGVGWRGGKNTSITIVFGLVVVHQGNKSVRGEQEVVYGCVCFYPTCIAPRLQNSKAIIGYHYSGNYVLQKKIREPFISELDQKCCKLPRRNLNAIETWLSTSLDRAWR